MSLSLEFFDGPTRRFSGEVTPPLVLGRRKESEPGPFPEEGQAGPFLRPLDTGRQKLIVARLREDTVSREHAEIERIGHNQVRVFNRSGGRALNLCEAAASPDPAGVRVTGAILPGGSRDVSLPVWIVFGDKKVWLGQPAEYASLPDAPVPPGANAAAYTRVTTHGNVQRSESEQLVLWLQAAMGVVHAATSSTAFFETAACSLVELLNLDNGWVMLDDGQDGWKEAAHHAAFPQAAGDGPSRPLLDRVRRDRRTYWRSSPGSATATGVLLGLSEVQAVVAAPILDPTGAVLGLLYGDRRQGGSAITRLEAMLIELLASSVATGLARLTQEQQLMAARVQFEQFFTPELSRELEQQPDLLAGRSTEVTILFCDLRGFSRIAERLGPARTVEWLHDVFGELSQCVRQLEGVLVDYIGDEVMAMWGAPQPQPDHALRACRAALAMVERAAQLNDRWQPILGEPMALGVGVNTGESWVGNTGSQYKFKYGPLGNPVNVASRVQGATKYLQTSLLVTESTWNQVREQLAGRRIGQARVVNIEAPVQLYELAADDGLAWVAVRDAYESALTAFERKDFTIASGLLYRLLADHPTDGPSRALLARVLQALVDPPDNFTGVWELPGK